MDNTHLINGLAAEEIKSLTTYMVKGRIVILKKVFPILIDILSGDKTDTQKFKEAAKYLQKYPPQLSGRATERAKAIINIIGDSVVSGANYLDYGCGDGSVTKEVAKELHLAPHGVDIIDVKYDFPYFQPGEIPDKEFKLVTAFASFHHIENIISTIHDIYKHQPKDGILFIREHDFVEKLRGFLNLIHLWSEINNVIDIDDFYKIWYRSAAEWDKLIESAGYKKIASMKYDGNNPQQLYYAAYKK